MANSLNFGNSSASALIKSANTAANEIATYNDEVANYEYSISAKTDDDLQTYQNYLNGRITSLNSTGTITDASKALSLTKDLTAAISSNTSASILRENIQVMAGNGTLTDKYNTIVSQFQRATSIGDDALAQSLESQAYSVSQSIQLQAQTAADSASALAKSGATATAGSQEHIATNLTVALQQLNNDIKNGGQKDFSSTISKWVSTNSASLAALGVSVADQKKGAQPNYFDIVNGVAGAIYNAHMLAYQAELPYNPDTAESYYNDAIKLASGITTLPTLAGNKSVQDIQQASANPAEYAYDEASGKLVQTQQVGNQATIGGVTPVYSGAVNKTVVLPPQQAAEMTKLGLNFSASTNGGAADGVRVQATSATPPWLTKVLGKNGVTNAYTVNGNLQFEADSASTEGKAVYTIVTDPSGHKGIYESSAIGDKLVGGDQGFNANPSSQDSQGFLSRLGNSIGNSASSLLGGALGLFGGHASAMDLVNAGLVTQTQLMSAQAAAARVAVAPQLPSLPTVTVNNTPTAAKIAQPTVPTTQSVTPQTANPQNAGKGTAIQSGSAGVSLQGGGIRLQ